MNIYATKRTQSPIERIELSNRPGGNRAIIFARPGHAEDARALVTSRAPDQVITCETKINGQSIFITSGDTHPEDFISRLGGDKAFTLEKENINLDAWGWRAVLGLAGQGFTLAGSFQKGAFDGGQAMFAGANILANFINIGYGASKSDDKYQLEYIKDNINKTAEPYGPKNVFAVDDNRKSARQLNTPNGPLAQLNNFVGEHSTQISIGLRYFGAANMTLSGITGASNQTMGNAWKTLSEGRAMADPTKAIASATSIVGKTVALNGKESDPYNPEAPSTFDKFRQHFFKAGGLMEAGAFGAIAFQKLTHPNPEHKQAEYFTGIGNSLFVMAYVIRLAARLNKKEVDMDELYAHTSDTLAALPNDQIPQVAADMAGMIKAHLDKEDPKKPVEFMRIYNKIANELYENHGVTILRTRDTDNHISPAEKERIARDTTPESHIHTQDLTHTAPEASQFKGI